MQGVDPDSSDEEWDTHIQEEYGRFGRARLLREAAAVTDADMDITGLVQNAFHQYEEMRDQAAGEEGIQEHDNMVDTRHEPTETDLSDDEDEDEIGVAAGPAGEEVTNAQRILEESSQALLYAGARMSSLSATMVLLQACRTHKCTSAFITELFKIL